MVGSKKAGMRCKGVAYLISKARLSPYTHLRVAMCRFEKRDAITKVDLATISSIVSRLVNVVYDNINLRALSIRVGIHVDHVAIFDDVCK
jgi:hypothetical protein